MPKMKGKLLGKTTALKLTETQAIEARDSGTIKKTTGGYQATFSDISRALKIIDGQNVAHVYDVILEKLKDYARRVDTGSYQDWSREVLTANKIDWQ